MTKDIKLNISTDGGKTYKTMVCEGRGFRPLIKLIERKGNTAIFEPNNSSEKIEAEWQDWMEVGQEYEYKID